MRAENTRRVAPTFAAVFAQFCICFHIVLCLPHKVFIPSTSEHVTNVLPPYVIHFEWLTHWQSHALSCAHTFSSHCCVFQPVAQPFHIREGAYK